MSKKELLDALEPFAYVMDWVDSCREEDRDAKFPSFGVTIHISTSASGFGLTLTKEQFEKAHKAYRNAHR